VKTRWPADFEALRIALMSMTPKFADATSGAAVLLGAPHARQVVRGGGQRPLRRNILQSAATKTPHAALLFQHPVHRFDDGLAPGLSSRTDRS
jgi:hypothetical protein